MLCFAEISFEKDVKPVFSSKCSQCHNSNTSLGNWLEYDQAYQKRYVIRNRVQSRKMPHFTDSSMTNFEINLIVDWVNTGAKE